MNRRLLSMAIGAGFFGLSCAAHAAVPPTACAYLAELVDPTGPPAFIASYPTVVSGPLHGAAFLYDNAVTAIALLGCGDGERAKRIGDAILWGLDHDRFWHDGRLRNAYQAGAAVDRPAKLAGWWDPVQNRWLEDGYEVGSDSGNMAWAMLALLALDRAGADPRYLAGAGRIAGWVAGRSDARGAGGFTGGFTGWEPTPTPAAWKSTEHNTDLAAAFALLATATGDEAWTKRSADAARLVDAMWDGDCACFATGTAEDGVTRNKALVLDAQIWPLLVFRGDASARYSGAFATVRKRLRAGEGYSYGEAGRGVWTEGTAYVALLSRLQGRPAEANSLGAALTAERAPDGGYYATDVPALATGFANEADPGEQRFYYHLPHLAAASWAALAERGFNPFTATGAPPESRPAPPK